jgi:hypothetical protein
MKGGLPLTLVWVTTIFGVQPADLGNYSALDKFLMSLIASIKKTDFLDIKPNFMFLSDFW